MVRIVDYALISVILSVLSQTCMNLFFGFIIFVFQQLSRQLREEAYPEYVMFKIKGEFTEIQKKNIAAQKHKKRAHIIKHNKFKLT